MNYVYRLMRFFEDHAACSVMLFLVIGIYISGYFAGRLMDAMDEDRITTILILEQCRERLGDDYPCERVIFNKKVPQ